MPYIDPEVVAKAKQMDLLTYLHNYDPRELIHVGGNEYTTRTHGSLKISNGYWNWHSRGIGGKNAFKYLVDVKGYSLQNAVETILGQAATMPPVFIPQAEKKLKEFALPQAAPNNHQIVKYLMSRGIDLEIIQYCIDTGRLYESIFESKSSREFHQCAFVGFDSHGTARYANIRGIHSDFKGEASGSDKRFSFSLPAISPCNRLHVFEAAIDALSYATLLKMQKYDFRDYNLLSLAGIHANKIPLALTQYLSDNPHIDRIDLHFDRDAPGRAAAKTIYSQLCSEYIIADYLPQMGNDINDYLCRLNKTKSNEKRNESR